MKQQPMARKLLALCLSLLLVLALSPTAWADPEKARVGEKKYATVQGRNQCDSSGSGNRYHDPADCQFDHRSDYRCRCLRHD